MPPGQRFRTAIKSPSEPAIQRQSELPLWTAVKFWELDCDRIDHYSASTLLTRQATTTDTGLKREQVGGVVIGIAGLALLLLLLWSCFSRGGKPLLDSQTPLPEPKAPLRPLNRAADIPRSRPPSYPGPPPNQAPTWVSNPPNAPGHTRVRVETDDVLLPPPPSFIRPRPAKLYVGSKEKTVVRKEGKNVVFGSTQQDGRRVVGWGRRPKKNLDFEPEGIQDLPPP